VSTELESWQNAMDYLVCAQPNDSEEVADTPENATAS
jgi:hypothetical protein